MDQMNLKIDGMDPNEFENVLLDPEIIMKPGKKKWGDENKHIFYDKYIIMLFILFCICVIITILLIMSTKNFH